MSNVREFTRNLWENTLSISVSGAALILDKDAAQCLKWSNPGGLASLWECGILSIRDIQDLHNENKKSTFLKSPMPSRLVFILSQHLSKYHIELHSWITSYSFIDIKIFTTISEEAHLQELALSGNDVLNIPFGGPISATLNSSNTSNSASMKWFPQVEAVLSEWMNESATRNNASFDGHLMVSIQHLPLTWSLLTDHIVLFPGSSSAFPLMSTRVSTSSSKVSASISSGIPSDLRYLGYSLMSFLDALNNRDEVFAMGEVSKQLGRFIISRSSSSLRRSSDTGIAVILVDRTFDLVPSTRHSDSILDQLYSLLPTVSEDSTDIVVNTQPLFGISVHTSVETAYASIAHGLDSDSMALMSALVMVAQRDGLVAVRKRLVDLIGKEVPNMKVPKILGKVTLNQLQKLLSPFVGNDLAFYRHGNLIQVLAAAIETYERCSTSKWDELMSIEKTILLTLSETDDATSAIHQLVELIEKTTISNNLQAPGPFTIMDLLCLTIYFYSLIGSTITIQEDDHIALMKAFMKALIPTTESNNNIIIKSEIQTWIHHVFDDLKKLSTIRSSLHHSQYRHVLNSKAAVPYVSLLKRVLMEVLPGALNSLDSISFSSSIGDSGSPSSSGEEDLQHIPYGGTLGNVFSGFRRLVGAGRPHPSQYKKILVFVIGGIAFTEAREIRDLGRDHDIEIILGSTNIATPRFILKHFLPTAPVGMAL